MLRLVAGGCGEFGWGDYDGRVLVMWVKDECFCLRYVVDTCEVLVGLVMTYVVGQGVDVEPFVESRS